MGCSTLHAGWVAVNQKILIVDAQGVQKLAAVPAPFASCFGFGRCAAAQQGQGMGCAFCLSLFIVDVAVCCPLLCRIACASTRRARVYPIRHECPSAQVVSGE
jgi:hypothetical protein